MEVLNVKTNAAGPEVKQEFTLMGEDGKLLNLDTLDVALGSRTNGHTADHNGR